MILKSRDILPAVKSGSINQQSDFSILADQGLDLWRNLSEIVCFQFIRRDNPQRIAGDNVCLNHAKPPSSD
jgi:hypothetical protein